MSVSLTINGRKRLIQLLTTDPRWRVHGVDYTQTPTQIMAAVPVEDSLPVHRGRFHFDCSVASGSCT